MGGRHRQGCHLDHLCEYLGRQWDSEICGTVAETRTLSTPDFLTDPNMIRYDNTYALGKYRTNEIHSTQLCLPKRKVLWLAIEQQRRVREAQPLDWQTDPESAFAPVKGSCFKRSFQSSVGCYRTSRCVLRGSLVCHSEGQFLAPNLPFGMPKCAGVATAARGLSS